MNRRCLIWRESVYRNNFICSECGKPLADANGNPYAALPFTPMGNYYACPVCFQPVAVEQIVDVSEDVEGLQGSYDKFLKKQKKERRRLRRR